jgi:hypothetical protein
VCVIIDGVKIGEWIWDTYIHHLELQVITALSLSSTLCRSLQHPLSLSEACCVFTSRSLVTASNNGDCSASRAHIVTVRRISRSWTPVNCKLNCYAISSQPPLQRSTQLPTLNWLSWPRGEPSRKQCLQQSLHCCFERLLNDSSDIVGAFAGRYQATHVPSHDRSIATSYNILHL